jgi:hypothetical protein
MILKPFKKIDRRVLQNTDERRRNGQNLRAMPKLWARSD